MELEKLKRCVIFLEVFFKKNVGKSRDVDFLIEYKLLIVVIEDVKVCKVIEFCSLGGFDCW